MRSTKSADEAVHEFRELSTVYWQVITTSDGPRSTKQNVKATENICTALKAEGTLESVLGPLLKDPNEQIRQAAAAYLITSTLRDTAIDVLKTLVMQSKSLVAHSAAAVLRYHKVEHDAPWKRHRTSAGS
jgi:hypothetical protein